MDFRQTLLVFISLFSLTGFSQTTNQWEEAFRQWVEAENMESSSLEELYDILSERVEQPINLNQATREELEQLPFLTAQQLEQLLEYTYRE